MRRIEGVRGSVLSCGILLIIMSVTHLVTAEDLSINLDAAGSLDAQLHGLEFSASITGVLSIVGDVPCDGGTVWFSSEGSAVGVGFRSILTLISKGWILLSATG